MQPWCQNVIGGSNKPLRCDLVAIGLSETAFLDIYVVFVCYFFLTGNVLYMWYTPRKHVWCNFDGWVQNLKISITFMLAFYLLLTTEVECLRIPAFAHKFLGSPRGKYCNSLERNVRRKVVWTSKKAILARDYGFFAVVLSYMDKDNVVTLEVKVFAGINPKYVILKTSLLA